ncbi:MAG TPA: ABC transporter permease [Vicinamibacterales bacterium]|nr:ABC transporter permease [Vicinamibacterales bacterium]
MLAEMGRALTLIAHRDPEVWYITGVSVSVSLSAVVAAVVFGLPLTYTLARSRSRVANVGLWIAHSAAALPTVVVGLSLYFLLSASGPLGWTRLLYTRTAMAAGQFVLALPLVVAVVLGALRRLAPSARETLITHGVMPARQMLWLLWEVKLAVMSGTCLAFSRAFTELGSALILGGNIRGATRTLTTYVALEYNRGDDARAIALGLILLSVAVATNTVMHALIAEE